MTSICLEKSSIQSDDVTPGKQGSDLQVQRLRVQLRRDADVCHVEFAHVVALGSKSLLRQGQREGRRGADCGFEEPPGRCIETGWRIQGQDGACCSLAQRIISAAGPCGGPDRP